jgi:hypothetical protein
LLAFSQGEKMFTIGEVFSLEEEPDPDLLVQIGWKVDLYDFEFYEAPVLHDGGSTDSWVEIAFSRQLGGAFVLWRSGVSALKAARSAAYGWVEGNDVVSIPQGTEAKANTYGPALDGYHFDTLEFYRKQPGEFGNTNVVRLRADCFSA